MKRIFFITIFMIGFVLFTPNVLATSYYDGVHVKTSFEESIDLDEIEEIEIHLEDATEYSKDYILEKENNFELTIEDVPVGPYKFIYGVVIGDEIGYYSVSANVTIVSEANLVGVSVNVEKASEKTTSSKRLTQEEIDKIKGTTTNNSTKKVDDDTGEIIIGDDNNDENDQSNDSEEKTTIPAEVEEARKKEEEENRKKEERKRNSLIGKIMFSIIGIVLLGLICYAAIKISNANK